MAAGAPAEHPASCGRSRGSEQKRGLLAGLPPCLRTHRGGPGPSQQSRSGWGQAGGGCGGAPLSSPAPPDRVFHRYIPLRGPRCTAGAWSAAARRLGRHHLLSQARLVEAGVPSGEVGWGGPGGGRPPGGGRAPQRRSSGPAAGVDRCRHPDFLFLRHWPGGPHGPGQLQPLQQQLLQVGTTVPPPLPCAALPCPPVGSRQPEQPARPPLLPGMPSSSRSSTAGPASLLASWSSPSWASWPQSRACTSPRWPSQVKTSEPQPGLEQLLPDVPCTQTPLEERNENSNSICHITLGQKWAWLSSCEAQLFRPLRAGALGAGPRGALGPPSVCIQGSPAIASPARVSHGDRRASARSVVTCDHNSCWHPGPEG